MRDEHVHAAVKSLIGDRSTGLCASNYTGTSRRQDVQYRTYFARA